MLTWWSAEINELWLSGSVCLCVPKYLNSFLHGSSLLGLSLLKKLHGYIRRYY